MSDIRGTPKKFAPTEEQYKKAIRALSKIGAVNYTVSDKLTKSQRATLRAKMHEFAHYIKRPEDFVVRKVSDKTAATMKKSGIKATKTNRAVIPLKGFQAVHIKGDKIRYEGVTKRGTKVTETVSLIGSPNFDAHLKHLSKKKLKRNQALTVKIGESSTLNRTFQNIAELSQYVNNINFKLAPGQNKTDILRQISIVEIHGAPQYAKKTQAKKKR